MADSPNTASAKRFYETKIPLLSRKKQRNLVVPSSFNRTPRKSLVEFDLSDMKYQAMVSSQMAGKKLVLALEQVEQLVSLEVDRDYILNKVDMTPEDYLQAHEFQITIDLVCKVIKMAQRELAAAMEIRHDSELAVQMYSNCRQYSQCAA